eukprot:186353_1
MNSIRPSVNLHFLFELFSQTAYIILCLVLRASVNRSGFERSSTISIMAPRATHITKHDLDIISEILTFADEYPESSSSCLNNKAGYTKGHISMLSVLNSYDFILRKHGLRPEDDILYYQFLLRLNLHPEENWWEKFQKECEYLAKKNKELDSISQACQRKSSNILQSSQSHSNYLAPHSPVRWFVPRTSNSATVCSTCDHSPPIRQRSILKSPARKRRESNVRVRSFSSIRENSGAENGQRNFKSILEETLEPEKICVREAFLAWKCCSVRTPEQIRSDRAHWAMALTFWEEKFQERMIQRWMSFVTSQRISKSLKCSAQ